jgi:hypothetical protein
MKGKCLGALPSLKTEFLSNEALTFSEIEKILCEAMIAFLERARKRAIEVILVTGNVYHHDEQAEKLARICKSEFERYLERLEKLEREKKKEA